VKDKICLGYQNKYKCIIAVYRKMIMNAKLPCAVKYCGKSHPSTMLNSTTVLGFHTTYCRPVFPNLFRLAALYRKE